MRLCRLSMSWVHWARSMRRSMPCLHALHEFKHLAFASCKVRVALVLWLFHMKLGEVGFHAENILSARLLVLLLSLLKLEEVPSHVLLCLELDWISILQIDHILDLPWIEGLQNACWNDDLVSILAVEVVAALDFERSILLWKDVVFSLAMVTVHESIWLHWRR